MTLTTHHPLRPGARRRRWLLPIGLLAATGATLLLGAGTALAHVSMTPDAAAPGSYTTLTFRVPNESDTASTTTVQVQLPPATPFPSVSAKQAPGWTIDIITGKLPAPITQGSITFDEAVTSVTFTAEGDGVGPQEFTTFDLLVGPVPEVDSISFVAVQTYSDGEVVTWNEPAPASGEQPEHPAPVLTVSAGAVGSDDQVAGDGDTAAATAANDQPQTELSDGLARVLGFGGILVGMVGIGIGLNSRRTPAAPGSGTGPLANFPGFQVPGEPRSPADRHRDPGDDQ